MALSVRLIILVRAQVYGILTDLNYSVFFPLIDLAKQVLTTQFPVIDIVYR